MGQRDDRPQDDRSGTVLLARLQERAVDLDGVERELVEVGKRRVAGAEVVERQADARFGKLPQHRSRLFRVLHDKRFGDLEPQRALRDDGAAEVEAHLLDQLRPEQLPARDVDAHEHRRIRPRQLPLPARHLAHGARQDVGPELDDEVRLRGHGDELGGIEGPKGGRLPTQQGLEASQRFRRQIVDRLVEESELLLLDGAPQVALERGAAVLLGAHRGVEYLDAIGPRTLGAIHGDLGLAQQLGGVFVGTVVEGDSDGGGEHDLLAGDVDGRPQRAAHLLGQHGEL